MSLYSVWSEMLQPDFLVESEHDRMLRFFFGIHSMLFLVFFWGGFLSPLIHHNQFYCTNRFINYDEQEIAKFNSVVSGALDRLHAEEDPCVRFDNEQKLWIYLHRRRSISNFGIVQLKKKPFTPSKRISTSSTMTNTRKENTIQVSPSASQPILVSDNYVSTATNLLVSPILEKLSLQHQSPTAEIAMEEKNNVLGDAPMGDTPLLITDDRNVKDQTYGTHCSVDLTDDK